jgi:OFA family oxalate/formate antiporter-like MFS transporter
MMSKALAPVLLAAAGGNLATVFGVLGGLFLLFTVPCAWLLRNPPMDPAGLAPAIEGGLVSDSVRPALCSARFAMMWGLFFCNIVAGIAIIGFQSPLLQDLLQRADPSLAGGALAAHGATLIAVSSLFNGLGRLFWGGLSDRLGRVRAFRLILVTQAAVFLALSQITSPWLFAGLVCYVLLCYGGGFGTMPAFVLDIFGLRLMPVVYGAILTAWSAAGLVGPQIVAWLKDHHPERAGHLAFLAGAAFLAVGFLLALRMPAENAAPRKRL